MFLADSAVLRLRGLSLHRSRGYRPPCCLPAADDPRLSAILVDSLQKMAFSVAFWILRFPPFHLLLLCLLPSQPVLKFPEAVQQKEEGRRSASAADLAFLLHFPILPIRSCENAQLFPPHPCN